MLSKAKTSGKKLLEKAWKYKTTKKKLYGETDLTNHVMEINKQYHKSKGNHASGIKKNKDGSANLLDSIEHEMLHKAHPKMREKNIRKLTRRKTKKLTKKTKSKLYAKFNK